MVVSKATKKHRYVLCPCGSGRVSAWEYDARHIPLGRMCVICKPDKLAKYRSEVLTNPNYEADEPIEDPT